MRAKTLYAVGALLAGVLLVWSCDARESNTGGLNSPCSRNSECGSGLVCAVNQCSNRSAGRPCSNNKECNDKAGLICVGTACGGVVGDPCRSDGNCGPGLICTRNSTCAASSGGVGDPCGNDGHCDGSFICQLDSTCGAVELGGLEDACDDDMECAGAFICAGQPGIRACAQSDGTIGAACGTDDHCPNLVCSRDNRVCRKDTGNTCTGDAECTDNNVCQYDEDGQRTCTVLNSAIEGACRNNDQCMGNSIICVGEDGRQVCTSTDGSPGSSCTAVGDCADGLVCDNSRCGIQEGHSCVADRVCVVGFVCTGTSGMKTCTSTDGMNGEACGSDDHCDEGLVCGDTGTCGVGAGGPCVMNDNICAGNLVCTGVIGSNQVCASTAGMLTNACGIDTHCTPTIDLVCSSGTCLIRNNRACTADGDCAGALVCQRPQSGQQRVCTALGNSVSGVCRTDSQCTGSDVKCIGDPGSQVCTRSDGSVRSACSNDDHCPGDDLFCSSGTCRVTARGACAADGDCADPLVCQSLVCTALGSSENEVCRNDDQCTGSDLICFGDPGSQVCTQSSGDVGQVCVDRDHCTGNLICSSGACRVAENGACTADGNCAGPLVCQSSVCTALGSSEGGVCRTDSQCTGDDVKCIGDPGSQVCTQSDGEIGDACADVRHCIADRGLVCSSGTCRVAAMGACTADGNCAGPLVCQSLVCTALGSSEGGVCRTDGQCTGSDLICVGDPGSQVCRQSSGGIGNPCANSGHCTARADLVCDRSACRAQVAGACTVDDNCAGTLVCQSQVCTALGSSVGGVCRADSQCTGDDVICIGDPGSQVCTQIGDGSEASVCNIDTDCDGSLFCSNNTCTATGITWTARTSNASGALGNVHYANNLWVAVGDGGTITTSTNGTTWTSRTSNTLSALTDVDYDNNQWVAVGSGGTILTSSNGTTWVNQTSGVNIVLYNIHYVADTNGNNGIWVAVGNGGTILTSDTSGTTWTAQMSGVSGLLFDVDHYPGPDRTVGGSVVAVGGVDGIASDAITVTAGRYGVAWADQKSPGSGTISNVSGILTDIHLANNQWIAVGTDGVIIEGDGVGLTRWRALTSGVTDTLTSVHYANNLWVTVGHNGTILTSSNRGSTWTSRTSNVSGGLSKIYYANNQWVAVGNDADNMGNVISAAITTSRDGITWASRTSNVNYSINDIHYANNLWVGVGSKAMTDNMGNIVRDASNNPILSGAITTAP